MIDLDEIKHIKAFAFDVDGVLTDGSVVLFESGEQVRTMNIKDGYAIQLAVKKGYGVAIISGGSSDAIRKRFVGLGVSDIYLSASNKLDVLNGYLSSKPFSTENVLYMGDDIPDYQVMKNVGMPCCPNDAVFQVKEIAKYISPLNGGSGCVRDAVEMVMKAQGTWFEPNASDKSITEFLW